MAATRVYFRPTSPAQRRLLFETWVATGDRHLACAKAHVCERTFYYWKPRFDAEGFAGLAHTLSHAAKAPKRVSTEISAAVIKLRQDHPKWGKVRIAQELAKDHDFQSVVAPNSVKRILRDAGLWTAPPTAEAEKKGATKLIPRDAPTPGETAHVDLALVPLEHAPAEPVPAVSSSSGHPVLCPPPPPLHYGPGRVFADPDLSYEQAMDAFVDASAVPPAERPPDPTACEAAQQRAARREVRRAQEQLRVERREERERRAAEDAAWRETVAERRGVRAGRGQRRRRGVAERTVAAVQDAAWRAAGGARGAARKARKEADAAWRAAQAQLRAQQQGLALTMAWIAVLVIVDSCTRVCVGLPVFASGAHVTAEEVVEALRELLPAELQYLITDRGTHFKAEVFEAYLAGLGVAHVLTARHRPQSNGRAERFVRTFKEWLADKAWRSAEELAGLLASFVAEYNERPHQGRGLAGLSPHECVRRKLAQAAA
jgi:transposase InsO family protein